MTSKEHIKLSDFIKSVHKKLREEAKILGTEMAWKTHCKDEENLEKYASAMQQLAVNHWGKNSELGDKVKSRVFWVYQACKDYFTNLKKYREKELNIFENYLCSDVAEPIVSLLSLEDNLKYKLLDVGSCYNPFQQFEMFEVFPIDIAPANKEVLKCDFLNLDISNATVMENQTVTQIQEASFDIIVFSLLLEYLPSSQQRLKCCLKAYKLLKPEGMLAIITPDSNHVGSNAKIFKSWRFVLAKHGFIRVKYEKLPYIHCMVFRKALVKVVAQRWAEVHESEDLFQEIFIPQDFTNQKVQKTDLSKKIETNVKWNKNTFLKALDCSICE